MNKIVVYHVERPNMPNFYLPLGMPLKEAKEFALDFFDTEPHKKLIATVYEKTLSSSIDL